MPNSKIVKLNPLEFDSNFKAEALYVWSIWTLDFI